MTEELTLDALYRYVQKELKSARATVRYADHPEFSSRAEQVAFRQYWQGQVDAWLQIRAVLPKAEKAIKLPVNEANS